MVQMGHGPPLRIVRPPPTPAKAPEACPGPAADPMETLFRDHARYVAAIALRILGRDDEVDDVVQEVFLAAIGGLRDCSSAPAVRGWLATVTVRRASRRLRLRRLRAILGLGRPAPSLPAPEANPEERVQLHRIYAALDELPVEQRVAWVLRHGEGEPLEDVARLCGCSIATAKRRIAAAHAALEGRPAAD